MRGGLGTWKTRRLRPREQATLVVHGEPGERLRLWCTVEGHVAAGMTTSVIAAPR